MLGLHDILLTLDQSLEATRRRAISITAKVGVIIAYFHRARNGLELPPVREDLSEAGHFLYLLDGKEPSQKKTETLDVAFVLHAEHGMNASTFTARVIASTGADVAASLSGAVGAMSGPLHGGAPARVLPMLEEVERTDDARGLVKGILDRHEKLMGFGHRVYRAEDPRARVLRATAKRLGAPRYEVAAAVEQAALAELRERRPDRAIETNVEFWAAVILDFAQVPARMMPAMFTCGRTAGWCAHILEQKRLGKLVRPAAIYVGPGPRSPESVEGWNEVVTA